MKENCIFCRIIKGELPSFKIYEDEFVYAFLDIANDYYGHTLVIPKKHFENVLDCSKEFLKPIMEAVQKISRHYINNCNFSGVNILNASGVSAEQSVMHLHFHIIPRSDSDGHHIWPTRESQGFELNEIMEKLKLN